MLAGLDGKKLETAEDSAVRVAVAGGEAVGARLQLDSGREGSHAWVVLEVEGAEVAILEFLEGEVRVIDGVGGLFAVVG